MENGKAVVLEKEERKDRQGREEEGKRIDKETRKDSLSLKHSNLDCVCESEENELRRGLVRMEEKGNETNFEKVGK